MCHHHALITSLPFVHTARRSYRLGESMKLSDEAATQPSPDATHPLVGGDPQQVESAQLLIPNLWGHAEIKRGLLMGLLSVTQLPLNVVVRAGEAFHLTGACTDDVHVLAKRIVRGTKDVGKLVGDGKCVSNLTGITGDDPV
eukprot:Selendium_serpulae@DN5363_c0_g1_i3.p1